MAPQAGFEPAAYRLTAGRSTAELLGNEHHQKARRRPTLPGALAPSTIGAGGLNFCVRNGNRCGPSAIFTGLRILYRCYCPSYILFSKNCARKEKVKASTD